ncbi:MAG: histidine phosphatase family protein [Proteobacteria bacterium]|nr:histidine phosphatase family protein [Pseudomonadota bacterium]
MRHAHSAPDPDLPEADWPLSAAGAQQAEFLVTELACACVQKIFSSSYLRAVATLQPLAHHLNLGIQTVPDVRERKP